MLHAKIFCVLILVNVLSIWRDFVNFDCSTDFCARLHLNMVSDHFNAYDPHLFPATGASTVDIFLQLFQQWIHNSDDHKTVLTNEKRQF